MIGLEKILKPIKRKVRQLFTRGVVSLIDSATLMQTVQVELLDGEVLDNVEHFEGYGMTAHAPADREGLAVSLNGRRSHTLVLAIANRNFRLKNLAEGEVAFYTDEGDVIHFKRGNEILIDSFKKVTMKGSEEISFNGNAGKVVTTANICSFTGAPHTDGCPTVKAG